MGQRRHNASKAFQWKTTHLSFKFNFYSSKTVGTIGENNSGDQVQRWIED